MPVAGSKCLFCSGILQAIGPVKIDKDSPLPGTPKEIVRGTAYKCSMCDFIALGSRS